MALSRRGPPDAGRGRADHRARCFSICCSRRRTGIRAGPARPVSRPAPAPPPASAAGRASRAGADISGLRLFGLLGQRRGHRRWPTAASALSRSAARSGPADAAADRSPARGSRFRRRRDPARLRRRRRRPRRRRPRRRPPTPAAEAAQREETLALPARPRAAPGRRPGDRLHGAAGRRSAGAGAGRHPPGRRHPRASTAAPSTRNGCSSSPGRSPIRRRIEFEVERGGRRAPPGASKPLNCDRRMTEPRREQ